MLHSLCYNSDLMETENYCRDNSNDEISEVDGIDSDDIDDLQDDKDVTALAEEISDSMEDVDDFVLKDKDHAINSKPSPGNSFGIIILFKVANIYILVLFGTE